MVDFVLLLQTTQDGDGGFDGGLIDQNLLKAALQSGVFFDVLAIFVQRGGPHTMQLAPRQCGLEHVAGVHGPLGLACANHGVQLVDEHNGLTFVFGQFAQHSLQAFFKLTPELRASQQSGHVE